MLEELHYISKDQEDLFVDVGVVKKRKEKKKKIEKKKVEIK